MNNKQIISELKRISKKTNGVLIPEEVVESARPKSSPLHSRFCWDDDKAAHEYRIWQARQLIRTTIRYIEINGDRRAVRVFVSLTPDREEESGGYRDIITVLSHAGLRQQLLRDALAELTVFETKYAHLKELSDVFIASKKARMALTQIDEDGREG